MHEWIGAVCTGRVGTSVRWMHFRNTGAKKHRVQIFLNGTFEEFHFSKRNVCLLLRTREVCGPQIFPHGAIEPTVVVIVHGWRTLTSRIKRDSVSVHPWHGSSKLQGQPLFKLHFVELQSYRFNWYLDRGLMVPWQGLDRTSDSG